MLINAVLLFFVNEIHISQQNLGLFRGINNTIIEIFKLY